ncbi:MAG: alpha/beta hydrolase [Pseudomonadota bacterium]
MAKATWGVPDLGGTIGVVHGAAALRVAHWPASGIPRGTVVVVTGRAEFIEMYGETIADLRARGFAVVAFDFRGQGGSARQAERAGHIARFDHYADDVATVVRFAVEAELPRPFVVLAHSMGGLAALMAQPQLQGDVARMILLAPLMGIKDLPLAPGMARLLASLATLIGLGRKPVSARIPLPTPERFEANRLTSDKARYEHLCDVVAQNPDLLTGPPSFQWMRAAFRAIDRMAGKAEQPLPIPTLFVASGEDEIVSNKSIDGFARKVPGGGMVLIRTARHQVLFERDGLRKQFFAAFDAFLAQLPAADEAPASRNRKQGQSLRFDVGQSAPPPADAPASAPISTPDALDTPDAAATDDDALAQNSLPGVESDADTAAPERAEQEAPETPAEPVLPTVVLPLRATAAASEPLESTAGDEAAPSVQDAPARPSPTKSPRTKQSSAQEVWVTPPEPQGPQYGAQVVVSEAGASHPPAPSPSTSSDPSPVSSPPPSAAQRPAPPTAAPLSLRQRRNERRRQREAAMGRDEKASQSSSAGEQIVPEPQAPSPNPSSQSLPGGLAGPAPWLGSTEGDTDILLAPEVIDTTPSPHDDDFPDLTSVVALADADPDPHAPAPEEIVAEDTFARTTSAEASQRGREAVARSDSSASKRSLRRSTLLRKLQRRQAAETASAPHAASHATTPPATATPATATPGIQEVDDAGDFDDPHTGTDRAMASGDSIAPRGPKTLRPGKIGRRRPKAR